MPISSIAQLLLRISALNWVIGSLTQAASLFFFSQYGTFSFALIASPVILLTAGITTWIIAPWLALVASRGCDTAVNLQGTTLKILYQTAFVSLGLYFALGNFARMFSWLHFYITTRSSAALAASSSSTSLYDLFEPLMTFAAGIILILSAHIWASKLAKKHQSEEGAPTNL